MELGQYKSTTKMKTKNNLMGKEVLIGIIILICISNISAFAISSDYWRDNPLKMYPSESTKFSLTLQNLGSSSDLRLKAVITTGSAVLRSTDSSNVYIIPAGERGLANFVATLPSDAKPGQVYNVKIDFSEVKDSQSGEFGFGTAIGQSFDIVALSSEEPTKPNTALILSIVGIVIVLGAILYFLLRKKKRKSSHHRRRKR